MTISTRIEQGVTILSPKGKITIGVGDIAIRNAIQDALNAQANKLIINMYEITMIDSSGIGELVSAYTKSSNHGAKLKLCCLPDKITDMLTITQLITILDVYKGEGEAIMSF